MNLLFILDVNAVPVFRDDYIYDEETLAFYKEHQTPQKWNVARETCRKEGAVLAVPNSKAQASVILAVVDQGTPLIWTGIHDQFKEGTFVSVEGES